MAISLSKYQQKGQAKVTSRKIAKEYREQQRKESGRKRWSGLFGGVGGKLLASGIAGAFGIASGGLLMPLIMGASSTMSKKWVDEASKKMGYGASPEKIKGDKYGYGRAEAKTLSEGLREQMKTKDWKKEIGKDIAMSYVGAGAKGKLGSVKGALEGGDKAGKATRMKQLFMGGKGDVVGTGPDAPKGIKGFFSGVGKGIGLKSTFGGKDDKIPDTDKVTPTTDKVTPTPDPIDDQTAFEDFLNLGSSEEDLSTYPSPVLTQQTDESWITGGDEIDSEFDPGKVTQAFDYGVYPFAPIKKKKEQGGLVQDQTPSIVDYFGRQGVSLGGSNKKSLAQILGRE